MGSMCSILGNMTDRRDYPHGLFYIDKSHINPFYDLFVRTHCSHIRQGIILSNTRDEIICRETLTFYSGSYQAWPKVHLGHPQIHVLLTFNKANLSHLVTENHNNGKVILMGKQTRKF